MAADVGYPVRALSNSQYDDRQSLVGSETSLITRDLLGESFSSPPSKIDISQELDLDLQVPAGWEKRLDLKSGKVYLRDSSSRPSRSGQETKYPTKKRAQNFMEEIDLSLKLVSSMSSSPNCTSCSYESVCTLNKVRSALDRAKREQLIRMSFFPRASKSPSTSPTSTKVTVELDKDEEPKTRMSQQQQGLLSAAGCPNCLMYVMISKEKPKCPNCLQPVMKKPRIDLNRKNMDTMNVRSSREEFTIKI